MQRDDKHSDDTFGGNWTDEKLTIIEKYLSAYTLALQNLPLRKVYIDAFAGDGMELSAKKRKKRKIEDERLTEVRSPILNKHK